MNIRADFHSHTKYSHGTGTVEDNVVAAMSLGLEALAITDHGERHPLIGVKPSRFDEMRRDVDAVAKEYRFRVLLGIEANILSPRGEIDLSPEDAAKLDVVLAGFHLTAYPLRFKDYFKRAQTNRRGVCGDGDVRRTVVEAQDPRPQRR